MQRWWHLLRRGKQRGNEPGNLFLVLWSLNPLFVRTKGRCSFSRAVPRVPEQCLSRHLGAFTAGKGAPLPANSPARWPQALWDKVRLADVEIAALARCCAFPWAGFHNPAGLQAGIPPTHAAPVLPLRPCWCQH